jgi:hypothetical protein
MSLFFVIRDETAIGADAEALQRETALTVTDSDCYLKLANNTLRREKIKLTSHDISISTCYKHDI